ncbi:MAG: methionine--tRNA ligase [Desulfurococcales archaeon]|nr:methionine--tRNA ligase [Desulfurococcales archaeon]
MGRFYVTTPIYYPNADPHIGHAYTTVYADSLARFHRLLGDETFFLTGTDEHGLKLQRAAEERGLHPKEFVDQMAEKFKRYWAMLDISYDRFIRTTDPDHERLVKHVALEMYRRGFIYREKYSGWYCVSCEKFYSPGEYIVVEGKPYCPIHRKPLEWVEEDTYYFRMSEFQDYILKVLEEEKRVYPEQYAREVASKIRKEGLRDVSIARPKSRVWWGVEAPFDPDYTIYVWFDALLNYITGAGYLEDRGRFNRLWPEAHHVIGKDILWFHTAVWFSMLKAIDVEPPKKVIVHAFLIRRGLKMGKSAGNVVRIEDLLERYNGSDGARYVLMRIFNPHKDVEYTAELLDSIYNSELADNYGNLVRRVGVLARKKLGGTVESETVDEGLATAIEKAARKYVEEMDNYRIQEALAAVMDLLREANAYINREKPWEKGEPRRELYSLLEVIRASTTMLHPVIPKATVRLAEAFGFKIEEGSLRDQVTPGGGRTYRVSEAPILFRKVK